MRELKGMITALSFPLMMLNIFGGIVSGIWLGVLRDWSTLGLGIFFFFFSTFLLGIVLIPSTLLFGAGLLCAEKNKLGGVIFFGSLCNLYDVAFMVIWCCGILFLFARDADSAHLIPRLIWSYGVATGPWAYKASKEQGGGGEGFGSYVATFLLQLAYLVVMVLTIFWGITLVGALETIGTFMLVALVIQVVVTVLVLRERSDAADSVLESDLEV